MKTFRSDNNAGLLPEAADALIQCASGHVMGYGDDESTAAAVAAMRNIFGQDAEVFFVATGTAANTIAVAALTEPWQHVVCHVHSHWNDDESTAPERFTGCRTVPVHGHASKLQPEDIARIARNSRGDVHQPAPGVVTISSPTEFGTVYSADEIRALADAAHAGGYALHLDGARFANAVARACELETPGEPIVAGRAAAVARRLIRESGVDALSFGGTKNGLAFGEAIVLMPQGDGSACARAAQRLPWLRKAGGHLLSKHRFVSAPFAAALEDGAWVRHAAHANAMAARLARGLTDRGLTLAHAVEANGIFVHLPAAIDAGLQSLGHGYYPFGDADDGIFRLMCSFDTQPEDVDALLADIDALQGRASTATA
ncbi:MAG: low specificity L-threonine aldolase [Phycisphaerales bacterium]